MSTNRDQAIIDTLQLVDKVGLAKAAEQSLLRRQAHGAPIRGWIGAWYMSLWARLGNAEKAYQSLSILPGKAESSLLSGGHHQFGPGCPAHGAT